MKCRLLLLFLFIVYSCNQNVDHDLGSGFKYVFNGMGNPGISYRMEGIIDCVDRVGCNDSFIICRSRSDSSGNYIQDEKWYVFYILRKKGFFYQNLYHKGDKILGPFYSEEFMGKKIQLNISELEFDYSFDDW